METERVKVLIVDDSALMRNLISRIIENDDELEVAGKALNGIFALQKIPKLAPDVIILDLEMPEMNGIEFLKERKKRGIEIPVIILSSFAKKGAQVTMEALSLGAADFIMKPSGSISDDIQTVSANLIHRVKAYGSQQRKKTKREPVSRDFQPDIRPGPSVKEEAAKTEPPAAARIAPPRTRTGPVEIIVIGISTGGPNALREVFASIDGSVSQPILVVQHMPPGFTEEFAKSLDKICPLEVKEAGNGDILKPGRILIAPGDFHLEVEKKKLAAVARLSTAPPVNGHRPSADVLFASVAKLYGDRVLAIIMTGMGKDGAQEIGTIYKNGGITIGQDEQSCVVFGMPKVAIEKGFIQKIVPLQEMAKTISIIAGENG